MYAKSIRTTGFMKCYVDDTFFLENEIHFVLQASHSSELGI